MLTIVRVIVSSLYLLDIAVRIEINISFRDSFALTILIQWYVLHLE